MIGEGDEAAWYLLPCVGYPWARKGQTPGLREGDRDQHLSVIRVMTETGELGYQIQDTSDDGDGVVSFLKQVHAAQQTMLTLIGEGASRHRGDAVTTFLRTENQREIQLERFPAYRPELNADAPVWADVKEHALKKLCCKTLKELKTQVVAAFERLKQQPDRIRSFFNHPEGGFY